MLLNINVLLILHINVTTVTTVGRTEVGLRIYLPFAYNLYSLGAGRITERGRSGAGKVRVDTLRNNERVC